MNHRKHLAMHAVIAVLVVGVVALRAAGVDVPTWVAYLAVAACPLMMISMMFGMNHSAGTVIADESAGTDERAHRVHQ